MGIDSVNGMNGSNSERMRLEDIQNIDVKDTDKLAATLAGIDNGVVNNIVKDGVTAEEVTELKTWKNTIVNVKKNIVQYFQTIRQTASDAVYDSYMYILDSIKALTNRIENIINHAEEDQNNNAPKIKWNNNQTHIEMKYEGIVRLAEEHPRAAASELNNLIERYNYRNSSEEEEALTPSQKTALRKYQKALDDRADKELAESPKQHADSSFYDKPENVAALNRQRARGEYYSHDLVADLEIVLPKDEQE